MNPSDMLASLLAKVNADALRDFERALESKPVQFAESSRKDLDVRQLPDFNERLKGLVQEFRASHEPHNFRSLRLLCHGCTLYIPTKKYTVIGDPDALDALLRHIMRYRKEPLRFRRLFHGLLRAYLDVERQADWFDELRPKVGDGVNR